MARDPYNVLGVRYGASKEEIREAYLDLTKKYHPDKYQDPAMKRRAEEKMKEVNNAYDILTKGNRQQGYAHSPYSDAASRRGWGAYQRGYGQPGNSNNQSPYYRSGGGGGSCCEYLTCLCCADSCCECMGGDLCTCC